MNTADSITLVVEVRKGKETERIPVGTGEVEVTTGYRCQECGEVREETADAPLYECGECGTVFNRNNSTYGNHQCECGRFAQKRADDSCVECEEGEVDPVEMVICPLCEEPVELGELPEHITNRCG